MATQSGMKELRHPAPFEKKLYRLLLRTPEQELNQAAARMKDADIAREVCFERGHCFRFLPIGARDRVLEISPGYGGVAAQLAPRCRAVDTLAATENQAIISALRNREHPGVTVRQGAVLETAAGLPEAGYQYILLSDIPAGVSLKEMGTLVAALWPKLAPGGKLCWAFANPQGLKYWAGCCPPGSARPFGGLAGSEGMCSRSQAEALLGEKGMEKGSWYYPYPDHINTYTMYTDKRLPQPGELIYNSFRWERRRALLFEESAVWDALLEQGRFAAFAGSYLLVMEKEPAEQAAEELIYGKISPVRALPLRILTRMDRDGAGRVSVRKEALTPEAQPHIRHMGSMYRKLQAVYQDTPLAINRMSWAGDAACFEYLVGTTLSEQMVASVGAGNRAAFLQAVHRLADIVQGQAKEPFQQSEGFCGLFGRVAVPPGQYSAACTDLDLNFDNILLTDAGWQVIDFEFSYDFPIPARYVLHRALHHFFENHPWLSQADAALLRDAMAQLAFTREEDSAFRLMEARFQAYVAGNGCNLENMRIGRAYFLRRIAVDPRFAKVGEKVRRACGGILGKGGRGQ